MLRGNVGTELVTLERAQMHLRKYLQHPTLSRTHSALYRKSRNPAALLPDWNVFLTRLRLVLTPSSA